MNIQNSFMGQINHEIRYRNCKNTNRERKMEKQVCISFINQEKTLHGRTRMPLRSKALSDRFS